MSENRNGLIKLRNVKRIETFDRLDEVRKQADRITQGIRDCIANSPFTELCHYLYIYGHRRSGDNPGEADRILWQPRLAKPYPQTNSMLFRIETKFPDDIHVIWIIPEREQWHLYKKGMMFENPTVIDSIESFENDRARLEASEDGDLKEEEIKRIYEQISKKAQFEAARKANEFTKEIFNQDPINKKIGEYFS